MSEKKQILLRDFSLFIDVVRSSAKILDSAKFIVDQNGVAIYGAREKIARCELVSNAIYSKENLEFSISDLSMLLKVLGTIEDVHEKDFTDFKFFVDLPFLKFESKKFKTKLTTVNSDVISKWISKKVETKLTPVFSFKTTSDFIRRVNSHTFMFSSDPSSLRVYLETKTDMENNAVFATLGNKDTVLNNEVTLKLGLVTFGALDENRKIILDVERMNLFNALQSQDIEISLMNMNVLVGKTRSSGKNDSYFSLTIYNTLLKS